MTNDAEGIIKVAADKLPTGLTIPSKKPLDIFCHSLLGNAKNRMFAQVLAFDYNNKKGAVTPNPCLYKDLKIKVRKCAVVWGAALSAACRAGRQARRCRLGCYARRPQEVRSQGLHPLPPRRL